MGIPFDQYQRYKNIEYIIKQIKDIYSIDKLKILEIGSNEQLNLGRFIPNEDITYSDLKVPDSINKKVKFISADATDLKEIQSKEFDVVISSDVFEHIPTDKREEFFFETTRVAKLASVHCFPFNSEQNKSAEIRTNEYYKALYGEDHIWLKEHIENGLPDINKVKDILSSINKEYFMFEHGDILLWEDMTKSTFYSYYAPELIALQDKVDDFYEKNIFNCDIGMNNYRKFIVISNDKELKCKLEKRINEFYNNDLSDRYLEFLYKNIEDIKSVNETATYRNRSLNYEQATIYFDEGMGFEESNKVSYQYNVNESQGYIDIYTKVKSNVKSIRFDPIEGKNCIISSINIYSNIGVLNYSLNNGFEFNKLLVFDNTDPQISIDTSDLNIEWINIEANIKVFNFKATIEIFSELRDILKRESKIKEIEIRLKNKRIDIDNLNSVIDKQDELIEEMNKSIAEKNKVIEEREYILKEKCNLITNQNVAIEDKERHIQNITSELNKYIEHYKSAISQRNQLIHDYNTIINSSAWKITKPLRVILDFIKKVLKSNKYTLLMGKGIRSIKNNGIKYTSEKVKNKVTGKINYGEFILPNLLSNEERQIQINTLFEKNIKFSIIVPLYNTPPKFLCEMINSCIDQTYSNWELCLADGSDKNHGYIGKMVRDYMKKDDRIKYKVLSTNGGISENTNESINMATGDYIALFDHDDILHPSALFEYMKVICEKDADFIYCDEDKFEKSISNCFEPHFKPDFAIDNLRANNYICHFSVFKKELLNEVGVFRKEFDGSQDHDMILRLTEKAQVIVHIPKILYHWRVSTNSVASDPYAKPYTIKAGLNAISEHLKRCNIKARVESSTIHPNIYRIKYEIQGNPLISILIPNKDHIIDLSRCINSIFNKSTYKNIEIIIIENNSVEKETFDYYESLKKYDNVKVVEYESNGTFNYSAINNFGAKYAKGEHLLLLNNDIEIISEKWIEEMLMYSQRKDVGAVGAKLYYPNDTIQHAGLGIGILTLAGHYFRNFEKNCGGYLGNLFFARNVSAVTAACLMLKKSVFEEVNGLDEEAFKVAFNDVDLCMKIRKLGYLIVWTPYAEAYHYESISRGAEDTPEKQERFRNEVEAFQAKWRKELKDGDPYYNPNLTLDREDYGIK